MASNVGKVRMKSFIVEEDPRTGGGEKGKAGTGDGAESWIRGQGSCLGKRAIRSEGGSKDASRGPVNRNWQLMRYMWPGGGKGCVENDEFPSSDDTKNDGQFP